jgi:hypothetical protein
MTGIFHLVGGAIFWIRLLIVVKVLGSIIIYIYRKL